MIEMILSWQFQSAALATILVAPIIPRYGMNLSGSVAVFWMVLSTLSVAMR